MNNKQASCDIKLDKEHARAFFKSKFIPGDNLPRDVACENALIMREKASLLIQAHASGGRFAPFMKSGEFSDGRCTFELSHPIRIQVARGEDQYEFIFKDVELQLGKQPTLFEELRQPLPILSIHAAMAKTYQDICKDRKSERPFFMLRLDTSISYTVNGGQIQSVDPCQCNSVIPGDGRCIDIAEIIGKASEKLRLRSLFDICSDISPYRTKEAVCRFFGASWIPYCETKESFSSMRPDIFHESEESERIESLRLSQILHDCKICGEFKFKDEHGETIQKAFRVQDGGEDKALVPFTAWMRDGQTFNSYFCTPLSGRQPLYNLDLLHANKAGKARKPVILTDSLEIAEANQKADGGRDFIWTSWLCDETAENPCEQVDWSPLKDAGAVCYLIENHSEMSLADAYIKAYKIADYLEDNYEIELRFIQAPAKFSKKGEPLGLEIEHFEIMESFDEFDKMYKKACEALTVSIPPWYAKAVALAPQTVIAESILERLNAKHDALPYLLRPFITRGEISLLHAATGLGKSALAYTLSASVIGGEMPFQEHRESGVAVGDMKWWTVPPLKDGFRKVLYMDFELGQEMIDTYTKDYFLPYLPDGKVDQEAYLANFDVRDLRTDNTDYTQEGNQPKILKMIEESNRKGSGRKVDMIVFDTYTRMAGGSEDIETWRRLNPLMAKLREMNIAVLLVHHSNKDGRPRGFMNKVDAFAAIAGMRREGERKGTLDMPTTLKATKLRASCVAADYEAFDIRFIGGKWTVHEPGQTSLEEFGQIVGSYKKANYGRDAIAEMMGMGHTACNDKMNAYKKKCAKKVLAVKSSGKN